MALQTQPIPALHVVPQPRPQAELKVKPSPKKKSEACGKEEKASISYLYPPLKKKVKTIVFSTYEEGKKR